MCCRKAGLKGLGIAIFDKVLYFCKMERIKTFVELHAFGVCDYLGNKLNIPIAHLRLFFVYTSFITAGSPIIIYLILAFLLKIKNYLKGKINPIWDF